MRFLWVETVPFGGNVSKPVHMQCVCHGLARQTWVREAAKPAPFLAPELSMVILAL